MMSDALDLMLPWELVAATEHHGPYIVNQWGGDVADLYAMSNPMSMSVRNGGDSFPVPFNNADANAAFIVKAVNSHDELVAALKATIGNMLNAKIALDVGDTKAKVAAQLASALKSAEDALAKATAS